MVALKDMAAMLGSKNLECRVDGADFEASDRSQYLFNTSIAGIEEADAILIVGSDPRYEASLLNARIRKRFMNFDLKVATIGEEVDLTYAHKHLGNDPAILDDVLSGKNAFAKILKAAKNPMIIVGMGALMRKDGRAVQSICAEIAEKFKMIRDDWNGFNMLHNAASRVGALDVGFVPKATRTIESLLTDCETDKVKAVYLLMQMRLI
jgi:NADH-quinone oxidoreductase subunit G